MFREIFELLFSNLSYKSYKYKTAPFYYQICEELTKYEKNYERNSTPFNSVNSNTI